LDALDRKEGGEIKANAFSLRKPATKPQFSRKRNRHCPRKRKSEHKRERERERATKAKKACYKSAIQPDAKPTLHQE
jgi:hypothetical protein